MRQSFYRFKTFICLSLVAAISLLSYSAPAMACDAYERPVYDGMHQTDIGEYVVYAFDLVEPDPDKICTRSALQDKRERFAIKRAITAPKLRGQSYRVWRSPNVYGAPVLI